MSVGGGAVNSAADTIAKTRKRWHPRICGACGPDTDASLLPTPDNPKARLVELGGSRGSGTTIGGAPISSRQPRINDLKPLLGNQSRKQRVHTRSRPSEHSRGYCELPLRGVRGRPATFAAVGTPVALTLKERAGD